MRQRIPVLLSMLGVLGGSEASAETLWLHPVTPAPAVEASCAVGDATGTFRYRVRIDDPEQVAGLREAAGAWQDEGSRPLVALQTRRTSWTRAAGSTWTAAPQGQVTVRDDGGHQIVQPLQVAGAPVMTHTGTRTDAHQAQVAAPLGAWAHAAAAAPVSWVEVEVEVQAAASARCGEDGFARARQDVSRVRLRF